MVGFGSPNITAEGYRRRIDSKRLYYVYRRLFRKWEGRNRGCSHRFSSYDTAGRFRADYVIRDTPTLPWILWLSDTLPIFGPELSAVAIAAPRHRFLMMGKTIAIYAYNAVLVALVKGCTRIDSSHRFAPALWWVGSMFTIRVWSERGPSLFNFAGAPSRGDHRFRGIERGILPFGDQMVAIATKLVR